MPAIQSIACFTLFLASADLATALQSSQQSAPPRSPRSSPQPLIQHADPADDRIAYTGRWDFSDPSRPWCAWQGSSLRVRFHGTRVSAELNSGSQTEYFRVIVDGDHYGSAKFPVSPGIATYTLADGLSLGVHQVELVKETFQGTNATFYGLEIHGSGLKHPPTAPARRIEFYGDSNLAGYSLDSELNLGTLSLRGSHLGYAGLTARMFDAAYHNVSSSGATISTIHTRFDRLNWSSSVPQWAFDDFPADLVVVNLGANDVGSGEATIKARYHAFLDDLRGVHPSAHIMLFNSWGWDFDEPATYIHEVIADRGDANMSSATFPWIFEQWHGCQYDHAGMASVLADHISATLGWTPGPSDVMSGLAAAGDVANGGFEQSAPFGGFGWRYRLSAGVTRVKDGAAAHDGSHFVQLAEGASIHQPIPASDGDLVELTVWARADVAGSELEVTIDFRNQEMYSTPLQANSETFVLTTDWQAYMLSANAPSGSVPVFHTRVTLAGGSGGGEVDAVSTAVQ